MAFYVTAFVLPSRELVVRVEDVGYTRGDMVNLLQAKQKQFELLGADFRSGAEIFKALQTIVENEIIAQSAPKLGVTVTEEEIDDQIKLSFTLPADLNAIDPGQVGREFKERYNAFLNEIQLSKSEYRREIGRQLLRQKFRQFIGESVPTVAEQVRVHRIAMLDTDEVDIMQVKFNDTVGNKKDPEALQEAYKQIVREFSRDDPESVRKGGDLGWAPRGIHKNYEDDIFALEPGQISAPINDFDDPRTILFFMISERQEARELDPDNLEVLKNNALQDWINKSRSEFDVFAEFNSDIYDWLLEQLKLTASTTPTPAPNPFGL